MNCNKIKSFIGNNLRKLLRDTKSTQKELAQYLGVTDNTVSYFCSGARTPNTVQMKQIADYFKVSVDVLYDENYFQKDIPTTLLRFRDLVDNNSRKSIAKALKCDVSTIAKHYNGERDISSSFVVKYAEFFHVSTDYLLGLTAASTTDKDVRYVCNYTGLSEASIRKIQNITQNLKLKKLFECLIEDLEKYELR